MYAALDRLKSNKASSDDDGTTSGSASDIPAVKTPSKKRARLPSGSLEVPENPSKRVKQSGKLASSEPVAEQAEKESVSYSQDESVAQVTSTTTKEDDSDNIDDVY